MPRNARIEYEGAVYHIMSRGQGKRRREGRRDEGVGDIVADDVDRELFRQTLEEACLKTGWVVHAWVLLSNHYHMLCETPGANLVSGMKWFQGTYAQRFNARHRQRGHVFQGRYKALLIESGEAGYFLRVSTYIHLNPVRAGIVKPGQGRLRDYAWSSYPSYLRRSKQRAPWLAVNRVFGEMGVGRDDTAGRKRYARYVEQCALDWTTRQGRKALQEEWQGIRRGWYLGGERFRDELLERLDKVIKGHTRESYAGEAVRGHDENEALRILEAALEAVGLKQPELAELPKNDHRKAAIAWVIRRHTTMRSQWISERLGMGHVVNVTNYVRRFSEENSRQMRNLRRKLEMILRT
jgi:putative transposase